jgi:hypothetical protein
MKTTPIFNERFVVCADGKYMQHDGSFCADLRKARKFVTIEKAVIAARTLAGQVKADLRVSAIRVTSRTLSCIGA